MKAARNIPEPALYFHDIRRCRGVRLLTRDEERALGWRIINDGDATAKQTLMLSNLRLVVHLAKRHVNHNVSFGDLIQDGNIGLLRAVESFDPARGVRFCSYASWWIKQAMFRSVKRSQCMIYIPEYLHAVMSKCQSASSRIEVVTAKEPTLEELSAATGQPVQTIATARRAGMLARRYQPVALEVGRDHSEALAQIPDGEARHPETRIDHADDLRLLWSSLSQLDDRSTHVLRLRFGLDGGPRHSLLQVSRKVGLTRERVRQIEVTSLQRLRRLLDTSHSKQASTNARRTRQILGVALADRAS